MRFAILALAAAPLALATPCDAPPPTFELIDHQGNVEIWGQVSSPTGPPGYGEGAVALGFGPVELAVEEALDPVSSGAVYSATFSDDVIWLAGKTHASVVEQGGPGLEAAAGHSWGSVGLFFEETTSVVLTGALLWPEGDAPGELTAEVGLWCDDGGGVGFHLEEGIGGDFRIPVTVRGACELRVEAYTEVNDEMLGRCRCGPLHRSAGFEVSLTVVD